MEALKAKGLEIYAAYGNTATDIRAYGAAGIPKVNTKSCPVIENLCEDMPGPLSLHSGACRSGDLEAATGAIVHKV